MKNAASNVCCTSRKVLLGKKKQRKMMTLFLSHAIPSRAHTPTVINFSHQLSIKLDNFNINEENVIVGKEKSTLFKQYLIYTQQELVQRSTTQITYRS
jgi:hypothetical protein